MFHVDLPTSAEIAALASVRAAACVSIYIETTPVTQSVGASRIAYGNLVRAAMAQLAGAGLDKRDAVRLAERLDDLGEDDGFWAEQAVSLAVLATPDSLRAYRLANRLTSTAQVSDRFHLKPLLRAATFPQDALVLALSENAVRLIEVTADLPPREIRVPSMPSDAASHAGKASLNDRSPMGRITGSEGKNLRLRQYARAVDAALRPVAARGAAPLILAATNPIADIFRRVSAIGALLPEGIDVSPERVPDHELAEAARPALDAAHARTTAALRDLYAQHEADGRATADIAQAARAATMGAVSDLMVDIDAVVPGMVDDADGAVTFADSESAASYGVVDAIAARAMATGARVLAVRAADMPGPSPVAAVLRYAV
jgi:hypothetical protein